MFTPIPDCFNQDERNAFKAGSLAAKQGLPDIPPGDQGMAIAGAWLCGYSSEQFEQED